MPMSPRLLRPIASGVHPEANAWRTAVVANGGSVSASTMKAVSTFCAAIDAAGIRDRFWRLNLFAGTGLNACLVPLYRGPSRTGTQYGNTTDTNNGPFVSGDYTETGASGGLNNTTTKNLNTGLLPDDVFSASTGHLSYYGAQWTPSTTLNPGSGVIGTVNAALNNRLYILGRGNSATCGGTAALLDARSGSVFIANCQSNNDIPAGFYVSSRVSTTSASLYQNATSLASSSSSNSYVSFAEPVGVFGFRLSNASVGPAVIRLMAYSAGVGMTAQQVTDFNTAMQAFQTSLGRNV